MPDNPNKLSRFWQELKRRKVIQVITVYASASFVLIELINNVGEPLNLPQGLSTIAIVVLAIGFPFAVVLSWIFDVTPKGIEKTKPSDEIPEEEKVATPNSWRIATYISVVVIVGLISFNLITRSKLSENLSLYGKSIAVLPFINASQNEEHDMFIDGTMENILNKLCKIKDLKVMGRLAVEPYRDTIVPVAEISEMLRVSHVLRGTMRKYGDNVVINVQLVDQNNNTVWSGQYDRDINDIEELFNLESKIAQEVAGTIKAIISPEEEQRIEKVPTTDLIAYQFCLEARSELRQMRIWGKQEARESAIRLFRQALSRDSTYADAIIGLAEVYLVAGNWVDRSQETRLDSAKFYIDRSLSYEGENSSSHRLLGDIYYYSGDWTAAERSYNKSLELNPNNPIVNLYLGHVYRIGLGDYVKAVQYYEEAEKRNTGGLIWAYFYREVAHAYLYAGYFDIAEELIRDAFEFDGDSAVYFSAMGNVEFERGNYKKTAAVEARAYSISPFFGFIGLWSLIYSEQIEDANRWVKQAEETGLWRQFEVAGYLSLLNGEKEKAEQYFSKFMDEFNKGLKLGLWRIVTGDGHVYAAMIYAYRGQKDKAYSCLDELVEMKNSLPPSAIRHLEINPIFENIREEERFQKILRKMQSDYQAAHERMGLYLEETGKL